MGVWDVVIFVMHVVVGGLLWVVDICVFRHVSLVNNSLTWLLTTA